MHEHKASACGGHQHSRARQQRPGSETVRHEADQEGERRGADEGRGGYRADLQAVEPETQQVHGQEHADEAVGERAHAAGRQQDRRVGGSLRRQPPPCAHLKTLKRKGPAEAGPSA